MAEKKYAIPAQGAGHFMLMGEIEAAGDMLLDIPEGVLNIGGNGKGYVLEERNDWDPTESDNQDGSLDDIELGDDVYLYAVQDNSGAAGLIASKNTTVPGGYSGDDSRKIGGFHYGRVRDLADAFDETVSLDTKIVPNSVWDLGHRPKCDPTGMAEIIPGRLWADIYLASEDGGSWPETVPLSEYNAVPLTGTEGYSRLDYSRLVRNAGKRLPDYSEFLMFAYGVPQGATGASDRVNTGIHSDYGFDCVSCLNIDQPSGNIWQQTSHYYDRRHDDDGWHDDLNEGKDSSKNHGQWRGSEFRTALVGGYWGGASEAGARCVGLSSNPWSVDDGTGLRAVCDSL